MSETDGVVHDPDRTADVLAIQDLAVAYGYAVDDADWARYEALFVPEARIDYTATGGIAGTPAEVAAWMPDAMAVFTWCQHSVTTHEIRFTGPDGAAGRVHVLNRNGVEWEGTPELLDVVGVYLDRYVRRGGCWRFSERVESLLHLGGGNFADVVRGISALAPGA